MIDKNERLWPQERVLRIRLPDLPTVAWYFLCHWWQGRWRK